MKFFILLPLLFFTLSMVFAYGDNVVFEETNYQILAAKMKQKKMGLVMMLHSEKCLSYALLDKKILPAMMKNGEYKEKVFIRKLQVDKSGFIIDFKGQRVAVSDFSV